MTYILFFLAMKEKDLSSKQKQMQKRVSKIALSTNVIQKMSKALKMARGRQATRHFAFLLLPQQSKALSLQTQPSNHCVHSDT